MNNFSKIWKLRQISKRGSKFRVSNQNHSKILVIPSFETKNWKFNEFTLRRNENSVPSPAHTKFEVQNFELTNKIRVFSNNFRCFIVIQVEVEVLSWLSPA